MKKHLIILALAIGASSSLLLAEEPKEPKPPGDGPRPPAGGEGRRPVPPLIAALDLNKDGVIDADELSKASESLKKLDKNNDGKLTEEEYRPHPPGERPEGGKGGGPGGPKKPEAAK